MDMLSELTGLLLKPVRGIPGRVGGLYLSPPLLIGSIFRDMGVLGIG